MEPEANGKEDSPELSGEEEDTDESTGEVDEVKIVFHL